MKKIRIGLISHLVKDFNLGCSALAISNIKLMDEVFNQYGVNVEYVVILAQPKEDIDLKDYFIEFEDYDDCKFGSRCIHQNEPNCAVKEAVENGEIPKERYESYIQLLNEIRQGKRRY